MDNMKKNSKLDRLEEKLDMLNTKVNTIARSISPEKFRTASTRVGNLGIFMKGEEDFETARPATQRDYRGNRGSGGGGGGELYGDDGGQFLSHFIDTWDLNSQQTGERRSEFVRPLNHNGDEGLRGNNKRGANHQTSTNSLSFNTFFSNFSYSLETIEKINQLISFL